MLMRRILDSRDDAVKQKEAAKKEVHGWEWDIMRMVGAGRLSRVSHDTEVVVSSAAGKGSSAAGRGNAAAGSNASGVSQIHEDIGWIGWVPIPTF
ncbi:hypothetical protein L1987_20912 [Smallanthus sonchifolius]|uniref:Uncharacterized protein n=1 Tax=Smallanthus sonchifolius TaxID=185202 RepID=A0ACB9ISE4_9ASTR|nr:hypothetical protein L1987_20912 [Smallanthus sonchifolius]